MASSPILVQAQKELAAGALLATHGEWADGLLPIKRGIHSRRLHCADAERLLMTYLGIENSVTDATSRLFLLSSSMFPSPLSERLPPARLQQHIDGLADQRLNLHPWLTGPTFIERELVECPR